MILFNDKIPKLNLYVSSRLIVVRSKNNNVINFCFLAEFLPIYFSIRLKCFNQKVIQMFLKYVLKKIKFRRFWFNGKCFQIIPSIYKILKLKNYFFFAIIFFILYYMQKAYNNHPKTSNLAFKSIIKKKQIKSRWGMLWW